MATITTDLICNLNQPVAATFLNGNLFSQDNAGNTINVHVMDNGEPATIGGTVSANVIRADGNTVAVSGTIEGNKASVVLQQACYAVPGRIEIIIKLTQSTTITTIAAIVANVYRSTTDTVVDPGTIIPSIQTLIEEIEEAVDSIPVDYSGLLATIAADYSSSKTYPVVGTYAWQGGVLKRNIVPITTAESYTAAHWTNAVLGDDVSDLKSATNNLYTKINLTAFTSGSIGFNDPGTRKFPKYVDSATQQFYLLTNCKAFEIDLYSGQVGVLTLNRSTGVWGSAESFASGSRIIKNGLTDYIIVHTGNIADSMDVYAVFDDYDTGFSLKNHAVTLLTGMAIDNFFVSDSSVRLCSGIIESKNISIETFNGSYKVLMFYTDENGKWYSGSYGYIYHYERKTSYIAKYIFMFQKADGTAISPSDIANQFILTNKGNDDSEVVHYNVSVIDKNGAEYTDESILVLPENYSANGEPVRLVVVCHGAGATRYANRTMDETGKILGDPQRVLTKMGYAVLDTFAAPYGVVGADYTGLHYGSPIVLPCYEKSIDFALSHFNLKQDGIGVCGSSMGGLSALQLISFGGYNVIAACLYCPCTDLYKQAWCNPWDNDARYSISVLYGFEGTAPTFGHTFPPSEEEKEYFKNNVSKTIGMYPMMFSANYSFDTLYNAFPTTATGVSEPAEAEVYEQYYKFANIPIKFFHCTDDPTVAYRYTKYICDMMSRAFSRVELVTYNSGGHAAWAAGSDVTLTGINGVEFTCKESQSEGYKWLKMFGT